MYPQLFLKSFWTTEVRPEVFVAMDFDPKFDERYRDVICEAVSRVRTVTGARLVAKRANIDKTGEDIQWQIFDGIAHSRLVLADVSTVGVDKTTGEAYRNANVYFELGLAMACRDPSEVLIVRDDQEILLFDTTTMPTETIDFVDKLKAIEHLSDLIAGRLRVQDHRNDARFELLWNSLGYNEVREIHDLAAVMPVRTARSEVSGTDRFYDPKTDAKFKLLQKGVLRFLGITERGNPSYCWTDIGFALKEALMDPARRVEFGPPLSKEQIAELLKRQPDPS